MLEAEGDDLERDLVELLGCCERARDALPELSLRQLGGVDDDLRHRPDLVEHLSLAGDGGGDAPVVGLQRVAVAGLAEAPDERLVGRLEEEDLGLDVAAVEGTQRGAERERRVAGPDIEHDGDAAIPLRVVGHQLREVAQQVRGHVVHDRVAEVLEQLAGGRLAGAREARDDRDVLTRRRAGTAGPGPSAGPWSATVLGARAGRHLVAPCQRARSMKMVNSNSRYITPAITMGLNGSPPGVATTAKIDDAQDDHPATGLELLDVQDAQLVQQHQRDGELHHGAEDDEHRGHEAEVRLTRQA